MKIAMTVWGNRISPVFESARTLLVAEIHQAEIVNRHLETFKAGLFSRFTDLLVELEIEVLICGALSLEPALLLDTSGIKIIPFMTGEAEMVLSLYVKGKDLADFTMPGCPRHRCCGTNRCANGQQRIRWC